MGHSFASERNGIMSRLVFVLVMNRFFGSDVAWPLISFHVGSKTISCLFVSQNNWEEASKLFYLPIFLTPYVITVILSSLHGALSFRFRIGSCVDRAIYPSNPKIERSPPKITGHLNHNGILFPDKAGKMLTNAKDGS